MAKPINRFVNLYVMHGRTGEGVIEYQQFLQWVSGLGPVDSIIAVNRELSLAIDSVRQEDGIFEWRVISGSPEEIPTYFDYKTGVTEPGEPPQGKWLAKLTRIVVDADPERRMLAIESARAGASASNLERYFSMVARQRGWANDLEFDISPVPAPSVIDEIDSLERIREASATVGRPNFDWSDVHDKLSELAEESGAQNAEAVVRAARKESLSRVTGLVGAIRDSIRARTPNIKKFKVVGTMENSSKEVTITSERHQVKTVVRLDPQSTIDETDTEIFEAGSSLIQGMEQRLAEASTSTSTSTELAGSSE